MGKNDPSLKSERSCIRDVGKSSRTPLPSPKNYPAQGGITAEADRCDLEENLPLPKDSSAMYCFLCVPYHELEGHRQIPEYQFILSSWNSSTSSMTPYDAYLTHYESELHVRPRTAGGYLDVDHKQHDCPERSCQPVGMKGRCRSIGAKTYKWVIIWTFLSLASFLTSTRNNCTRSVDHPSTLVKSSSVNPSIPSRS